MRHARQDYNRIQDPENLIPADEPVFLIRAKDISSVATLRFWAAENERLGADKKLIQKARDWSCEMENWQIKHGCKVADE